MIGRLTTREIEQRQARSCAFKQNLHGLFHLVDTEFAGPSVTLSVGVAYAADLPDDSLVNVAWLYFRKIYFIASCGRVFWSDKMLLMAQNVGVRIGEDVAVTKQKLTYLKLPNTVRQTTALVLASNDFHLMAIDIIHMAYSWFRLYGNVHARPLPSPDGMSGACRRRCGRTNRQTHFSIEVF